MPPQTISLLPRGGTFPSRRVISLAPHRRETNDRRSEVNCEMKHSIDVHVGQRIRQRRCLVGLTLQELGESVGIKFQQIQKYETGANRISASRMWDIAAVMEVPVSFFFEGLDGQASDMGKVRGDPLTDKEALDLVRTYYKIPENQRRQLFDLARALGEAA